MADLILHPTLGVNPHLTACPRCGRDADEIVLLGRIDTVYTCVSCHAKYIDWKRPRRCEALDNNEPCHSTHFEERPLDSMERVPASQPCAPCRAELDAQDAAVAAGGAYFRCTDCGASGAIKPNDFTAAVRREARVPAPAPVGVEFTKTDCPACGPNRIDPTSKM